MKNPIYSIWLIVSLWSCIGKENTTYKEGLLKCQENTRERQAQIHNGIALNSRGRKFGEGCPGNSPNPVGLPTSIPGRYTLLPSNQHHIPTPRIIPIFSYISYPSITPPYYERIHALYPKPKRRQDHLDR